MSDQHIQQLLALQVNVLDIRYVATFRNHSTITTTPNFALLTAVKFRERWIGKMSESILRVPPRNKPLILLSLTGRRDSAVWVSNKS